MAFQKRSAISVRQHDIKEDQIIIANFGIRNCVSKISCNINIMPIELHARSRPRVAQLVREGDVLHGTWRERDDTGSLRIELSPTDA